VEPRERIRKLLVLGDNRVKQGDARILAKARESYEEALALARVEGLEGQIAPLVELRLAEVDRLSREAPSA
jgi:hypothetical protein